MDHNWGYVAAGYALTPAVVVAYAAGLLTRRRRARRDPVERP
jgi:hypothetical protein